FPKLYIDGERLEAHCNSKVGSMTLAMRRILSLVLVTFAISLVIVQAGVVQAQWSALNSGYAVTTDYHGKDVPPGTLVTATAGTTDDSVESVTFIWKDPDGNVMYTETDFTVESNGTEWDGMLIYYAQSSYAPTVPLGDWGVQAVFMDSGHIKHGQGEDIVAIRATSFFVIPEVPFGTAVALLSLLGALVLVAQWQRKPLLKIAKTL
nr:hypothetical protein [Candidatus Njordarchaeum guaymaensis]